MERRDFMTSVGSLMALGTLNTPLVGNATTGGLTPGDLSEEGLDAYMDEVRAQIKRIEATRVQPEVRRHLRQRGMPARLTKDMARMMLVTSAVRDLPPELQKHAKVQRRLRREAPRIGRTVMRLTDFVKGHSPEELQELQAYLQEHPDHGEEITANLTDFTYRQDMPPERREQARQFMESTTWRMTYQSPSLVLNDCTQKIDRIAARSGFQQENWEAHLEVMEPGKSSQLESDEYPMEPIAESGVRAMGIGLGIGLGGLVLMATDVLFVPGAIGTTVGAGLVFIGFLMLIFGSIHSALTELHESD